MLTSTERNALARDYMQFAFSVARRTAPRHLRDEAESVALVGLEQAVRRWRDDGRFTFPTWVGLVVRRRVLDWLNKDTHRYLRRTRPLPACVPLDEHLCGLAACVPPDSALDETDAFERRIVGLSASDRGLMRAVFLEGLVPAEVARREDRSVTHVYRRYRRALEWVGHSSGLGAPAGTPTLVGP